MRLAVRLFAICRERAGRDIVDLELLGTEARVENVKSELAQACPAVAPFLGVARLAVNQEFADESTIIRDGDELALIPPVSGGSGAPGPFRLTTDSIDAREVEECVRTSGTGAVVTFIGVVRDKTHEHEVLAIEYEAYPPMAERTLAAIGDEVTKQWPRARIAITHRFGRLAPTDVSVVIAVASPHRDEAFLGCRHAIERLKQDVPIWKKEFRKDGTVWVGMGS